MTTVTIPSIRALELRHDGEIPRDAVRFALECQRHGIPLDEPLPDNVAALARDGYWDLARHVLRSAERRDTNVLSRVSDDITAALERALGPTRDRTGIFVHHDCSRCQDGALPCREGNPNTCGYPVARNH